MMAAGLGVDYGYLRYQKRLQQAAADSAAIAGASEIAYGDVTSASQADSASNGYTDGANNVTVTVSNPPNDGPHAGDAGYVEVLVAQIHSTFFAKAVGFPTVSITARAVAWAGGSGGCIYALEPSGTGILMNGSPSITSQCGVIVDSSTSGNALLLNGSGFITAPYTGVVGGVLLNGSVSVTPPAVTGIVPASDPLAYLDNSKPSITAPCSGNSYPAINGNTTITVPGNDCYNVTINGANNNVTLSPGNFGSVTINGSNNTVTLGAGQYGNVVINGSSNAVTFGPGQYSSITGNGAGTETYNSGTYVISSGALILNGANGITGSGVVFYLGPNAGALTINGSNTTDLSAPTSGTFAGILIFQDPADTNAAVINGSNGTVFNGALYFPKAQLTMNGSNSASSAYTILVVWNLVMNGTDTFNDNYAALAGGSPVHRAILVE
jgi:hypothetical protein